MLELQIEKRSFDGKDGKEVNYNVYFVELSNGVKVYMKPNDNTGKQLLDLEIKE